MRVLPPAPAWLRICLERKRTVIGASCCLLVASLWVASFVPLEWSPSVGLPEAMIFVAWPGASPEQVEREVTAPIEKALRGVPSGGHLESVSQSGAAFVRLELQDRRRLSLLFAEIADRLAAVRPQLPEGVVPLLERRVPDELIDAQGFITLEARGDVDATSLRRFALERLEPRLRSVTGVSRVAVEGGRDLEVRVELLPDQLKVHGLEPPAVRQALVEATTGASHGSLREAGRSILLLRRGLERIEDLRALPIARKSDGGVLLLGEVAAVASQPSPLRQLARIDGKPAVTVRLEKSPDSALLETADAVHARLAELAAELPPAIGLRIAEDSSENVRRELRKMLLSTAAGGCLVVLILLLSLHGVRSTVLVLLASGLSACVALALMAPMGLSFNLVTLAGLALVFGLLVDNALVVVLKLAEHHRRHGATPEATALAISDVALPLIGCTATTVVVFFPLAYLDRELRDLFVPFGWVVAGALVFSLLAALFLVPVWAGDLGADVPRRRQRSPAGRLGDRIFGVLSRRPGLVLVVLALLIGLPTPLLPVRIDTPVLGFESAAEKEHASRFNATLGSERAQRWRARLEPLLGGVMRPFLEVVELGSRWGEDQHDQLLVSLELPPGSDMARIDEVAAEIESLLVRSPSVERTFTRVIGERATVRGTMRPEAMAGLGPLRLRQELIDHALGLAGCEVGISGLVSQGYYSGVGTAEGLTIEASGPSYEELGRLGRELRGRLRGDLRVVEIDLEAGRTARQPAREVMALQWDREAVARTGLSAEYLAGALLPRLDHPAPGLELELDGQRTHLRITLAGAERLDIDQLLAMPLPGPAGPVPLAGALRSAVERQPPTVERIDQRYRRYFRVFYRGPFKMGKEAIEKALDELAMPVGYQLELKLQTFFTGEIQNELIYMLLGSLGAILLVMAIVSESWSLPLVTLFAVPMSFVGVALGFIATKAAVAEGAFLGFALLAGLAVNHGILLMDRYARLRRARPHGGARQLGRLALRQRLTPMWATTIASIAGLVPILFAQDSSDLWRSLAITVGAGLLSSALLMPAAFLALVTIFDSAKAAPRGKEKGSPE